MLKLLAYILTLSIPAFSFAQEGFNLQYKNQFDIGPQVHTYGFGIVSKWGKQLTADKFYITELGLVYQRNPRQTSKVNRIFRDTRPYPYAKLNDVFTARLNAGLQNNLADKMDASSIKINLNYSVGVSAAILKPVFIGIIEYIPDETDYTVRFERYDPYTHTDETLIFGKAGFFEGIRKTYYTPGINGKLGLSFEWGNYDYKFSALSTGIQLDYFPAKIEEFAFIQNKKIFTNLYLNLSFGKRW